MQFYESNNTTDNELLFKALRLFVEDKIDPEALKIMLRDVFEIDATRINTKLFNEVGPEANRAHRMGKK